MVGVSDIRTHLLGCLEVALFMPEAVKRFGSSYDEMIRSFFIPALLFPLTHILIGMFPPPEVAGHSDALISLMYSLRFTVALGIFLGFVYFISNKIERTDHFYQFVTANNWLIIPSTLLTLPLAMMLTHGTLGGAEVQALAMMLVFYSWAYTAFMAACVLRIPLELAGFIAFIGFVVNDSSHEILGWVGSTL